MGADEVSRSRTIRSEPWHEQQRTFWLASGLLAVLLLIGLVASDNGYVATPDEGVYAAQAQNVANGAWASERPAPLVDETGKFSGLGSGAVLDDGREIPHARHPAYTAFLSPLYRLGGVGGMYLSSVLGVWMAALAAGLLARRMKPALGIPALLLTGIASPLIFDAYLVSAHALGAGLAGLAVFGAVAATETGRLRPLIPTLLAACALVLVRSEGTVVLAGTVVVLGGYAIAEALRRTRPLRTASWLVPTALGVVTIGAYQLDKVLSAAIRPDIVRSAPGQATRTFTRALNRSNNPLDTAWDSLLRPWNARTVDSRTVLALAVVFALLAAVCVRLKPDRAFLPLGLGTVAAVAFLAQFLQPAVLITGLVPAFVVLPAGLIQYRARSGHPIVNRLLLVSAVSGTGILFALATSGGSTEWGGRFFHVLIPLLVPCALYGGAQTAERLHSREVIAFAVIVATIALAMPGHALRIQRQYRNVNAQFVANAVELAEIASKQVPNAQPVSERPLVIVGNLSHSGNSRLFWNERNRVDVLAPNQRTVMYLVDLAKNAGYTRVVLATNAPQPLVEAMGGQWLATNGWAILGERASVGTSNSFVLGPASDR